MKVTERTARKALNRAIDWLLVAAERQGFHDGWRADKRDDDGELRRAAIVKLHAMGVQRRQVRRVLQIYASTIRGTRRPTAGPKETT